MKLDGYWIISHTTTTPHPQLNSQKNYSQSSNNYRVNGITDLTVYIILPGGMFSRNLETQKQPHFELK